MTTAAKKKAAAKRARARKAASPRKSQKGVKRDLTQLAERVHSLEQKYGATNPELSADLMALEADIRGYDQRDDMPKDGE